VFRQTLVHETPDVLVTWLQRARVPRPLVVDGRTILEADSPIVWFTFPGALHDIGRLHTAAGGFTGLYANVLTPVEIAGDEWRTTDLFLDVLLEPGREPRVLDADELEEAVARGWLDEADARTAEEEAARLVAAARAGDWPPPVVDRWPLERARAAAGHSPAGRGVSPATQRPESEE
jgi:predicted RNA-binding protein associated with RNAse of E/G family